MGLKKYFYICIFYAAVVLSTSSFYSCSNSDDETSTIVDNDEYYVKYTGQNGYGRGNIIYTDKSGFGVTRASPVNITVGPVKKGFKASIHVVGCTLRFGSAKIEVSKNGGVFMTMASGVTYTSDGYFHYTIDF